MAPDSVVLEDLFVSEGSIIVFDDTLLIGGYWKRWAGELGVFAMFYLGSLTLNFIQG